jgi:hypothetical protein
MAKRTHNHGSVQTLAGRILTAHLADLAVTAAKIANLTVTAAKIAANTITADKLAYAGDDGPNGSFVVRLVVAAGAAADVTYTATFPFRVIDAWAVHTGGAGEASDTLTIKKGSTAIFDALDWSGADKAIVRVTEVDDAQHELQVDDELTVSPSDNDAGDDVGAGIVYVLCERIAAD